MLDDKVLTSPLRFCPLIGKKCLGAKCMFWTGYTREDGIRLETCTFLLQPVLQGQLIVESMRVQASEDKVANEVSQGFGRFIALARASQRSLPAEEHDGE